MDLLQAAALAGVPIEGDCGGKGFAANAGSEFCPAVPEK